ncbi:hypothetical protein D3C72_2370580 [compost metagenome]
MQHDLELAARELIHLVGELLHVLRLEAVGAITRGQVPLDLGLGGADAEDCGQTNCGFLHGGTPC